MRVLLIEDDDQVAALVVRALERDGLRVEREADGRQGLDRFRAAPPDACLLDLRLPGMPGLEILAAIREHDQHTPVVILTGEGSVDTAVESMRRGADDFLRKPFQVAEMRKALDLAIERRLRVRQVKSLREELLASADSRDHFVIGESEAMRQLVRDARTAAVTSATILVTGASGTGKSHLAQRIHAMSGRADGPFVAVSGAALPAELVESELFGHVKGAFTGADASRSGRFEAARGGTIFLDEIGEMPMTVQPKLLRVLQSGEYEPLGASGESRTTDARVIAATNRDLEAAIGDKTFRQDLYFRLAVVELRMPSLVERRDDVPMLLDHFVHRYARLHDRPIQGVARDAVQRLQDASWPGNVRQLANVTERAVIFAAGPVLEASDFAVDEGLQQAAGDGARAIMLPIGTRMDEAERRLIEGTLAHFGGNRERAARALGMSLSTLYRRLREYESAGRNG